MTTRARSRYRLKVGAMPAHTPSGWGWWYEVHDMGDGLHDPDGVGHPLMSSGLRYTWPEALAAGFAALRYVTGNRACGFD